jgi:site-specific DNA-methyltransferase (adenine-specific)
MNGIGQSGFKADHVQPLYAEGGRWPANVVLDADQAAALDEQRFFYVAKAPKKERPVVDGVAHPTVKPLALMRWLVRLITPPGGVVLDPFAGSGTTVEAALLEDFRVIGIEREADYLPMIQQRIARCLNS